MMSTHPDMEGIDSENVPFSTLKEYMPGHQCPECGCPETVNVNLVGPGYRVCKLCRQEWWIEIDYSKP